MSAFFIVFKMSTIYTSKIIIIVLRQQRNTNMNNCEKYGPIVNTSYYDIVSRYKS